MASTPIAHGTLSILDEQAGALLILGAPETVTACAPSERQALELIKEIMSCPFCSLDASRKWLDNAHAIAFPDPYPVADGHTLVVPRKHVESIYELSADEQSAVWTLVAEIRQRLLTGLRPDGFNIGLNDGLAAGQTVEHAHVHVIPRRKGDVRDPRGGIRWIIDEKANYWAK